MLIFVKKDTPQNIANLINRAHKKLKDTEPEKAEGDTDKTNIMPEIEQRTHKKPNGKDNENQLQRKNNHCGYWLPVTRRPPDKETMNTTKVLQTNHRYQDVKKSEVIFLGDITLQAESKGARKKLNIIITERQDVKLLLGMEN